MEIKESLFVTLVALCWIIAGMLISNTGSEATNKDFLFRTVLSFPKLKMRSKLVFYVGRRRGCFGRGRSLFRIFSFRYWFSEKSRHLLFTGNFRWLTAIMYRRFPLPFSTNLILIFNLTTDRKIKKYQIADVTSERVKNASFYEYSSRSDYWHRCYLILFLFFVRF